MLSRPGACQRVAFGQRSLGDDRDNDAWNLSKLYTIKMAMPSVILAIACAATLLRQTPPVSSIGDGRLSRGRPIPQMAGRRHLADTLERTSIDLVCFPQRARYLASTGAKRKGTVTSAFLPPRRTTEVHKGMAVTVARRDGVGGTLVCEAIFSLSRHVRDVPSRCDPSRPPVGRTVMIGDERECGAICYRLIRSPPGGLFQIPTSIFDPCT
jgi:hypothetical protein